MPPLLRYNRAAIALHWLMAVMILATLGMGLVMHELELSPLKLKLYAWHKWLGVTLFGLALVRLLGRFIAPPPPPLPAPAWQVRLAGATHALLYALMCLVPLSGWLMSSAKGFQTVYLGLLPLPDLLARDAQLGELLQAVHVALNNGLLGLLAVHVGAALKHHYFDRDATLARMWPARNEVSR
jgi:cytochrome b561